MARRVGGVRKIIRFTAEEATIWSTIEAFFPALMGPICSDRQPFYAAKMDQLLPVLVALKRHAGYEDVHPDLVMEDAMKPGWPWSFVRDEGSAVVVAIERPEGYERTLATTLAKDVVKPTWPSWSVVKR